MMKRLKKTLMILLSLLMCFNCVMTVSADEEAADSSDSSKTHTVHYEFVSEDPEEELPEEVMTLIPEDLDGLEEGDEVENLPIDDVVTEENVYVFLGWSEDKLTVGEEDLTIVGTWKKKAPEADEISGNNDTDEPEGGSSGTCCVEYVFLKYGTFFSEGLPKEVMDLLPEKENVPLGQDPDLPEFGITAGFQFKGWDKAQISYDDGSIRTVYYGFWDRLLFGVIPVSGTAFIILRAVLVFIEPPILTPSNLTKISALSCSVILFNLTIGVWPTASSILLYIIIVFSYMFL